MKQKQSFLLILLLIIISSNFFTACSNYLSTTQKHLAVSGIFQDIFIENRYWESTQYSHLVTMELPRIRNNLQPDEIKSVIIISKGISITAGYLNWNRNNLYKYEVVNSRIILYWQIENLSEPYEPVTIVIRLQQQ